MARVRASRARIDDACALQNKTVRTKRGVSRIRGGGGIRRKIGRWRRRWGGRAVGW